MCNAIGVPESTKFINLIPPTAIAWLLQYSGSRVEQRDGFSSCKLFAVGSKRWISLWIKGVVKIVEVNGLQAENILN